MSTNVEPILTGILEGEHVLEDDYPVHFGYMYVCDGQVVESPIGRDEDGVDATVFELRIWLNCREVRNCKLAARNIL